MHDNDEQTPEYASRREPVEEDIALQLRTWRFERIGLAVLLLLILLALLGLFSKGPLSNANASSSDGQLSVEYQRFSRNDTEEQLHITLRAAPGQQLAVVLDPALLQAANIEAMHPLPGPSRSQGQGLSIPMLADPQGVAALYLTLRTQGIGLFRCHLQASTGQALTINKFIYP
ncbi:hypothetical protein [Pseudomonas typographi]|uniref:hypothetical protein n=1 Tax=Pseudomonas typographi TaxID=2715964 RepID=UPI00168271B2|nr:hypothetical protein [Pseudomonas typographi]MBD1552691.1 hypothetical protein [Pseudomonas typographi]MBD1588172.1 hypothetical protein [Pseudomonas typographi]